MASVAPDQETSGPGELPDDLIRLISPQDARAQRPVKRRRTSHASNAETDGAHVVLRSFNIGHVFDSCKLGHDFAPRKQVDVRFNSREEDGSGILEILNASKRAIWTVHISKCTPRAREILDALALSRIPMHKCAKDSGRLWTQCDISIANEKGADRVRLGLMVKWNVTYQPTDLPARRSKVLQISQMIRGCFPDPDFKPNQAWSPQDFYDSVHTPARDQSVHDIQTPALNAKLYPFQQRALQWLLEREGIEHETRGLQSGHIAAATLPRTFHEYRDAIGKQCYVSHVYGIVTFDPAPFQIWDTSLRGGLLAEEMGLGKTVELIALISLHTRPLATFEHFKEVDGAVTPIKATLIITPPSIHDQWISEINKHVPSLRVYQYTGIKNVINGGLQVVTDAIQSADIVLTTYPVLRAEIFHTNLNPPKSLRHPSIYPRVTSPLMQYSWWRVCLDEAQMVESGVTNAALVAQMIPRINAWAVTGTPVRNDLNDLRGLLLFLHQQPYASLPYTWNTLSTTHKPEFQRLFSSIALRHNKHQIRDEIVLPTQQRNIITIPFTPVEEQHYQNLFTQMCESTRLDSTSAPREDDWDSQCYAEAMRTYLAQLRRTALLPEVGTMTRRALGRKAGPLRTVDQVLGAMIEQSEASIRTEERGLLLMKLERGQIFENSPRILEARKIWQDVLEQARKIVSSSRERVSHLMHEAENIGTSDDPSGVSDEQLESDERSASTRLALARRGLRDALEVYHVAMFFCANATFQIKSDAYLTKPESPEFQALEKLEIEQYEMAKATRREILKETVEKAEGSMDTLMKRAKAQDFVTIPEFPRNLPGGGLESRRFVEDLQELGQALDNQANVIDEWREKVIKLLLSPLVDKDEEDEVTGEEYNDSTKVQEEIFVYLQALRAVMGDRYEALTGVKSELAATEAETALAMATSKGHRETRGPMPDLMIRLLNECINLRLPGSTPSLKAIHTTMRQLDGNLVSDSTNPGCRAQNEQSILQNHLKMLHSLAIEHAKANKALEKELELFTSVLNTRLEFYRQLQKVSDMVVAYEGCKDEQTVERKIKQEEQLTEKIDMAKSKLRYLQHLKETQASSTSEHQMCVICRDRFEIGALTVCGHQFCKECIRLWWHSHRTCPICKRKLKITDLHDVTYKPQKLTMQVDAVASSPTASSAIFKQLDHKILTEIKSIELVGPSYTTKVDTLARHLVWLRENDPGAKAIIFSVFKDFLDVLAIAFKTYRIGYASVDERGGIERFKHDAGVECFLLHARAYSSGLNLVEANHVFFCEPMLNTALELQAIARVDRIGQQRETNVWLYLIDGTVEESIHALSVRRRLEHMHKGIIQAARRQPSSADGNATTSRPSSPLSDNAISTAQLEEANSLELRQASLGSMLEKASMGGGELVTTEDLWECLFGNAAGRRHGQAIPVSAM